MLRGSARDDSQGRPPSSAAGTRRGFDRVRAATRRVASRSGSLRRAGPGAAMPPHGLSGVCSGVSSHGRRRAVEKDDVLGRPQGLVPAAFDWFGRLVRVGTDGFVCSSGRLAGTTGAHWQPQFTASGITIHRDRDVEFGPRRTKPAEPLGSAPRAVARGLVRPCTALSVGAVPSECALASYPHAHAGTLTKLAEGRDAFPAEKHVLDFNSFSFLDSGKSFVWNMDGLPHTVTPSKIFLAETR